jgi:hypothetical protein
LIVRYHAHHQEAAMKLVSSFVALAITSAAASMLLLLALGSSAYADDILAGGPSTGAGSPAAAYCWFYNAGNTSVIIKSPSLYNVVGGKLALSANTCNDTPFLAARHACIIGADTALLVTCRAIVSPSAKTVRGILHVGDAGQGLISYMELR